MKHFILIAFTIVALIQWIIPGKLIWEKGHVLKNGQAFKFRTEPVDPSNPFKGKYITLNFTESVFTDTAQWNPGTNKTVYVLLEKDQRGFAVIKGLSLKQPLSTTSFVKANVSYVTQQNDSVAVHIDYPFDEFYMDEYKAPVAETVYRESSVDTSKVTFALVRILKGDAVLENVFINDRPIGEIVNSR